MQQGGQLVNQPDGGLPFVVIYWPFRVGVQGTLMTFSFIFIFTNCSIFVIDITYIIYNKPGTRPVPRPIPSGTRPDLLGYGL
jgi:hypothetical protein